jgi:hypothetical protein
MALKDEFRRVVQNLEFYTQKLELKKGTESWEDKFDPNVEFKSDSKAQ